MNSVGRGVLSRCGAADAERVERGDGKKQTGARCAFFACRGAVFRHGQQSGRGGGRGRGAKGVCATARFSSLPPRARGSSESMRVRQETAAASACSKVTRNVGSARDAVARAESDSQRRRRVQALPEPVSQHVAASGAASRQALAGATCQGPVPAPACACPTRCLTRCGWGCGKQDHLSTSGVRLPVCKTVPASLGDVSTSLRHLMT